jgi:hypothetical protein
VVWPKSKYGQSAERPVSLARFRTRFKNRRHRTTAMAHFS